MIDTPSHASPLVEGRRGLFVATLAGLTLAMAFPDIGLWPLAWIAPGVLLLTIRGTTPLGAALRGWLYGLAFFGVTLWWVTESMTVFGGLAPSLGEVVALLLAGTAALFPALFAGLVAKVERGLGTKAAFATAPFLWVAVEFWRERLPEIGFPWARLGDSQYRFTPIIQIADLGGTELLSFVMIAFGAAMALGVIAFLERRKRHGFAMIGVALLLFGATVTYGISRTTEINDNRPPRIRVAAIQGNIDQHRKWDPDYAFVQFDRYDDLTRTAVQEGADLVVWPETAAPWYVGHHPLFDMRVRQLSASTGVPIIFGAPAEEFDETGERMTLNRAWSVEPDGTMTYYDKVKLAPFGEYVPFARLFSFVRELTTFIGDIRPGDRLEPLPAAGRTIAVQICFEAIFPEYSRQLTRDGAQLLAIITNDSWFGLSASSEQALAMGVMRAVENRLPMVRAAQSGISAIVGADGVITQELGLFERGIVMGELSLRNPDDPMTLYTRYGDLFRWMAVFFSGVALVAARRPRG